LVERSSGANPFSVTQVADPERYADEIKVLLSSQLTSELSDRLRQLGNAGAELLDEPLREERTRLTEFSSKLGFKE
jgi:hypothetical protein